MNVVTQCDNVVRVAMEVDGSYMGALSASLSCFLTGCTLLLEGPVVLSHLSFKFIHWLLAAPMLLQPVMAVMPSAARSTPPACYGSTMPTGSYAMMA